MSVKSIPVAEWGKAVMSEYLAHWQKYSQVYTPAGLRAERLWQHSFPDANRTCCCCSFTPKEFNLQNKNRPRRCNTLSTEQYNKSFWVFCWSRPVMEQERAATVSCWMKSCRRQAATPPSQQVTKTLSLTVPCCLHVFFNVTVFCYATLRSLKNALNGFAVITSNNRCHQNEHDWN